MFKYVCFNHVSKLTEERAPLVDLTFESIDDQHETFAVSAYLEENRRLVRIFLLKKVIVNPLIYCLYVDNTKTHEQNILSNSMETFAFGRRKFGFRNLTEPSGLYRGFVIFCRIPPKLLIALSRGTVSIALHLGNASPKPPVILPIRLGFPLGKTQTIPSSVGLCVTPSSEQQLRLASSYFLEYIELNRLNGIELILFYLNRDSSHDIKHILSSYLQNPSLALNESFRVQVIPWSLPARINNSQLLPLTQNLLYNDCIFRIAQQVGFIFHTNLAEIFVPHQFGTKSIRLKWPDILHIVRAKKYRRKFSSCLPTRFAFPSRNTTETESIFDRNRVTVKSYSTRQKCLTRSDKVQEVYLHRPIRPKAFNYVPELGTVFNYGTCEETDYEPCRMDKYYTLNNQLQSYQPAVKSAVSQRLRILPAEL
ncbi:hypothetical protein EG68_09323 [Paragonimus skrjabini miyazakii]|uniref:Glycosyltransferase family 92 protein n=1 Tax=Paragonimus skrjabini miyazakii TaxID=59628 RepID=A0A8S9YNH1_9TREM|nr:hypothetical protein EG68_09323 [Paragonimus skrjabini miyazakii]